jgi:hypothetical protein
MIPQRINIETGRHPSARRAPYRIEAELESANSAERLKPEIS